MEVSHSRARADVPGDRPPAAREAERGLPGGGGGARRATVPGDGRYGPAALAGDAGAAGMVRHRARAFDGRKVLDGLAAAATVAVRGAGVAPPQGHAPVLRTGGSAR